MKNILIIDDDKLIRWALKEIFSQEGYTTDEATSFEQAIKSAAETKYDLIIADLEINQENSASMLERIKKLQPGANIIIVSALSKSEIEKSLKNIDIYGIIEKPFQSEQIRTMAKKALKKSNCQREVINEIDKKHNNQSI